MFGAQGVHYLCSCWMEISWLWQVEFMSLFIFSWKSDWRLFCYTCMESTVCFLFCWKFLAWGWWNFELVQSFLETRFEIVLLGTHGVHCLFIFVMEILCLSQLEFWACSNNVRYTQCALSVFLRDGKFFVWAGGILSLNNFSWKSDWRVFCYAHLVSTVCFLSWWKFLA